jgi:hypothetical protein
MKMNKRGENILYVISFRYLVFLYHFYDLNFYHFLLSLFALSFLCYDFYVIMVVDDCGLHFLKVKNLPRLVYSRAALTAPIPHPKAHSSNNVHVCWDNCTV